MTVEVYSSTWLLIALKLSDIQLYKQVDHLTHYCWIFYRR